MKLFMKDVLAGILMGLILPGIMLNFAVLLLEQSETSVSAVAAEPQQMVPMVISLNIEVLLLLLRTRALSATYTKQ